MALKDKWVKDLLAELKKKTKEELMPATVPATGSNLIEPTLAESLAMVAALQIGKTPYEVTLTVKRGNLNFSLGQVIDAQTMWQQALAEKSVPVEVPTELEPK